jgi:hypothetical protein
MERRVSLLAAVSIEPDFYVGGFTFINKSQEPTQMARGDLSSI